MRRSPLIRCLVLLCVLSQLAMTLVRSGDRVVCIATPAAVHDEDCGGDHEHHARTVETSLPHDHDRDCCIDIRVPNNDSRPDQCLGLPPLPPPALIAIVELPEAVEILSAPSAPRVEPRGIPPALGLRVTRIQV